MRISRMRLISLVASAALAGSLAACNTEDTASGPSSPNPTTPATTSPSPTSPSPASAELTADDFANQKFTRSHIVNNKYLPLRPGMQLELEGSALDEGDRIDRRVVMTVTNLTKVISGVRAAVIYEQDYNDDVLSESELAFLAQDDDGNVWRVGEYPEVYEEGKLVEAPTWIHGIAGAKAGISMKHEPKLGTKDYAQGFAPPPINWADRARVYQAGARTCVPVGCYSNVLVTEEFELEKPNAFQLKYYAPGLGNVRVGWRGSAEEEKEVLELVEFRVLNVAEQAQVRRQALALERHAYQISKDVYGRTEPAR